MQNAAFSAMGLSARRLAFRVRRERERLRDAILGAEAMGFGGLNLMMPLKVAAEIPENETITIARHL
jgi:shikimate dehydrogenase